jgi:hypothetical protein
VNLDLLLPLDHNPPYSRVLTGPVQSLHPDEMVEVRGSVVFPIPTHRRNPYPWELACRPEEFAYRFRTPAFMYQRSDYRDHMERDIWRKIAEAVADRFVIHMDAEVVW